MTSIHSTKGTSLYSTKRQCSQSTVAPQFGSQVHFGAEATSASSDDQPTQAANKSWWESAAEWFKNLGRKQEGDSKKTRPELFPGGIGKSIARAFVRLGLTTMSPSGILQIILPPHGLFAAKHFTEGLFGRNSLVFPRVHVGPATRRFISNNVNSAMGAESKGTVAGAIWHWIRGDKSDS